MSIPIAKKYIKDFEGLGFGVFIHFGLYSLLNEGEWVACPEFGNISKEEYHNLTKSFNPCDMEEMVKEISKSGAKYITFTTRHHDGFSLYDTKGLSTFDSVHSACGRDLVREFVDACRKYDIIPFFYHTTLEWWNDDFDNDFDKYLKYLRDSVEVLCKNYGKIGGFWFDGCWSKEGDVWQEDKLYEVIRKYQPDAMIINNTGLSHHGESSAYKEIDSVTFERGKAEPMNREGQEKYLATEVCDSISCFWGIADDINFKSPKEIIEMLTRSRAAGANLLLNIFPNAEGRFEGYCSIMIDILAKWMNMYKEAVYCGRPCWFRKEIKEFILEAEDKCYLFVFDLPIKGTNFVIPDNQQNKMVKFDNFNIKLKNIKWMDNDEELEYRYENESLFVKFEGYKYGKNYCVRVASADKVK